MTLNSRHLDASFRDDKLEALARKGGGMAFAELAMRHRDALYTIACNLGGGGRPAQEILQQALLTAWREIATLRRGARFTTWLYGTVTRTALQHRRLAGTAPESPAWSGPASLLRHALHCMDDEASAAFVLCEILDLYPEEAAVILGSSPRAVRGEAHRVRLMLMTVANDL
jgi:RNA polymerase sigma-70 factor (ECF subfamily)